MKSRHPLALVLAAVMLCSAQTSHVAEVLAKVAPTLRGKTSVPLRLPSHIARLDDGSELYAITRSLDETGYEVVLGATPDCQGQHICSYGFLLGTTRPVSDFVSQRICLCGARANITTSSA